MSTNIVGSEFKGLARDFRRRVDVADAAYGIEFNRILKPLQVRLSRKPKLRDETMIEVARAFQSINNPFRLRLTIDTPKRGHLKIVDWVIGASSDREDAWEDWERTTAIIKIDVNTQPGGVHATSTPIATISGHAIARWYQRSASRDQSKLLMDLGYLMHPTPGDS